MSLLRKGLFVSGGQILGVGLNMIVGVLFSRTLGPEGMGQVELLRSTALISGVVLAMGLGQASIYFLNNLKVPLEILVSNTVKVALVLGLLLAGGLAGFLLVHPDYFGVVPVAVVVAYAIGAAATLGTNLLRPVLVAQLAAGRMVAADLAPPLLMLVASATVALALGLNPGAALVVQAFGSIGAAVLIIVFLRKSVGIARPFEWGLFRRMIVYGFKLSAANILYVLAYHITVLLLRYLVVDSFDEVGLYTRAVAVCGLVTLVPVAIGPLLYSKWSGLGGEQRTREAEMAMRLNVAYGFVSAVGILLLGRYIIWLLYGARFIHADVALVFLAPALFFVPIFGVYNSLLAGDGRAGVTACILAGTVCVVGAVTYLAAPAWGIRGAALAVLCGNVFTALAGTVACWSLYRMNPLRCLLLCRSDVIHIVRAIKG